MSDESRVDETTDATDSGNESQKLSYDELEQELKRTRAEAASKRVRNRAQEAELEEFRAYKESQKTELQKANERAHRAERDAEEARKSVLQIRAAKKAGLDLDLAERLVGDSEEELLEDAKQLAGRTKASKNGASVFGGVRGKPVGSNADEDDEAWFRRQFS